MRIKILLLSLSCFFIMIVANAQINKGRYLAGGSFSMYSSKNYQSSQSDETDYLNVNVQFGKIIKQNTVVGLICAYNNSKSYFITLDSLKSSQYSLGVFYRKYSKLANDFYFFAEANASYFHTEDFQLYQNGAQRYKSIYNGVTASFVPGISYTVCKRMQAELLMPNLLNISYSQLKNSYRNVSTPSSQSKKGHAFSINANLNSSLLSNFGIGFKFFLGK